MPITVERQPVVSRDGFRTDGSFNDITLNETIGGLAMQSVNNPAAVLNLDNGLTVSTSSIIDQELKKAGNVEWNRVNCVSAATINGNEVLVWVTDKVNLNNVGEIDATTTTTMNRVLDLDNRFTTAQTYTDTKHTEATNYTDTKHTEAKAYTDSVSQGLDPKQSCRVATVGDIDIANLGPGITIDGVSVVEGDRVLVKNQVAAADNGIYTIQSAAPPSRSIDFNTDSKVTSGAYTFVEEGSVNANNGFSLVTDGVVTLGTSDLEFQQFSGAGQISAGDGLTKSGNRIDIVGAADRISVNADNIDIAATYVGQSSIQTVGKLTQVLEVQEDVKLDAAKSYYINEQNVLSESDLGLTVINSNLSKLGIVNTLNFRVMETALTQETVISSSLTSGVQKAIDSVDATIYRGARWWIMGFSGDNVFAVELTAIHNGVEGGGVLAIPTVIRYTENINLSSGSMTIDFTVAISGTNMKLMATTSSAGVVVNVHRQSIVGLSAPNFLQTFTQAQAIEAFGAGTTVDGEGNPIFG